MPSINPFVRLVLLALPAFASPLLAIKRQEGEVLKDSYIVMLNDGYNISSYTDSMPGMNVTSQWDILNGFTVTLSEEGVNQLRALPGVSSISENGAVTSAVRQRDAPWGLERISHRRRVTPNPDDFALDYTYRYDRSGGHGVDVYVIDTGIQISHPDFGGRARWGATFGPYFNDDGHGHGTHCAGTVGSEHYGVSKACRLIAVKVLSDGGGGWWSDVISGIDWVARAVKKSGRPSVASISIQGGAFSPVDDAVTNLVKCGVPTAIAAGNYAVDAELVSPGRTRRAITVGATDIYDNMATFSDYGRRVDIFAPGVNVWSTWIGSTANVLSGTSQATPHVSGFIAYLLGMDSSLTVRQIERTIDRYATKDAITLTNPAIQAGTDNKLLYNNYRN